MFVSDQLIDAVINDIDKHMKNPDPKKPKELKRLGKRFDKMITVWFAEGATPQDLEDAKLLVKKLKKLQDAAHENHADIWGGMATVVNSAAKGAVKL